MHPQWSDATISTVSEVLEKPNATYQDVLDAPETEVAQLIGGTLYTHARPRMRHSDVTTQLVRQLGNLDRRVQDDAPWRFLFEPELHMKEDVLIPDVAAWRVERFPSEQYDRVNITVAPDWVCEVLSPTTARIDRVLKLPRYGPGGVEWAWLVDPQALTIEVFRYEQPHWVLQTVVSHETTVELPPFAGFDFPLAKLWAR